MKRKQTVLEVKILQDPVPGWGHKPEDHLEMLQSYLDTSIPHYKPKVTLIRTEEKED